MPKEKELFRDNLQILNERFPDKFYLTVADVVKFTGFERHTVKRKFNFDDRHITKTQLARDLS